MQKLPHLKPGDSIEIIAPASRCPAGHLDQIKKLLGSWQLKCILDKDIFGDDLLCANTDEVRFRSLKRALENSETKAIICARGGYGSMRLIPDLLKITPPSLPKLFIGMSDITALNLFFERHWCWPTLHGALALDKFSDFSIEALKKVIFGDLTGELLGLPLNPAACKSTVLTAPITGGNLCLVQTSIGTLWQIDSKNKILFLEEVGERAYRIDRMLEHLAQANIFKDVKAVLFGDFMAGEEPNGSSLIQPVLERFANNIAIPVVQIAGLGHGYHNLPLPLGTVATLQLGEKIRLTVN